MTVADVLELTKLSPEDVAALDVDASSSQQLYLLVEQVPVLIKDNFVVFLEVCVCDDNDDGKQNVFFTAPTITLCFLQSTLLFSPLFSSFQKTQKINWF